MWLLHHRCYHRCNLQGQYDNSKALRQLVWRTLLWWKNDLDSRTWLISMFSEVFSSYEHVLAALSKKQEAKFPCLYSRISFCCHFGILKKNPDFFQHRESYTCEIAEISVAWFLQDCNRMSMFTWDPKWTQTGLKFHFGVIFRFGVR